MVRWVVSRLQVGDPLRLEHFTEWSLGQGMAHLLFSIWGQPTVDFFTTIFAFSCLPDPLALWNNALQADSSEGLLYMCPPQTLLPLAPHRVV